MPSAQTLCRRALQQLVKKAFGVASVSTFGAAIMKRIVILLLLVLLVSISFEAAAQCSICSRTAAQLGERPARGLNAGIIYLAATPVLMALYIGYRWWRRNGRAEANA